MLRPTNEWPDTPTAQNMRLFAQLMSHKAAMDTFESFRAMSLDTVSRLREAVEVLDGVEAGRPLESFRPVKEELVWSMERDPVLDEVKFAATKKFIYHLKNEEKAPPVYTKARISVLERLIAPDYKSQLEWMIVRCISSTPGSRLSAAQVADHRIANDRRLALLASLYVTHLTSIGYSKSYILYITERYFFNKDASRVRISKVKSYFDQFDGTYSNFRVFLLVNEQAKNYFVGASDATELEREVIPGDCAEVIDRLLAAYPETPHVITIRQKAVDIFTAGQRAFAAIKNYQSSAFLGSWGLDLTVTEELVVSTRGFGSSEAFKVGHGDIASARKVYAPPEWAADRSISDTKVLFHAIKHHADPESADRILNALATAHSAASSQNAETQLIALWSAFEALLSPPPPGSSSRVAHYSRLILPMVCSFYAGKNCIYVSNLLVRGEYPGYNTLVDRLKATGLDYQERYRYLIVALTIPEHAAAYEDLVKSCESNRLVVNLLISLRERFSSPSRFYEFMDVHEKKAAWQISRMYRARNQIVHAGIVPNFAESVAVNAFEYLASMIWLIARSMDAGRGITCIEHVIERVSMNYYSAKEDVKRLQGGNVFDGANVFKAFASQA